LSQDSIRHDTRFDRSCQCEDENGFCSGFSKHLGTFIHGRASRKDVVDQENAFLCERLWLANRKGLAQILYPFFPRQRALGF
jgi:hypothetical protein